MEASIFKTKEQILEAHPDDFSEQVIDRIPLRDKTNQKDKFVAEVNTKSSIKTYAKSVINPPNANIKTLMSKADILRSEKEELKSFLCKAKIENNKEKLQHLVDKLQLEFDQTREEIQRVRADDEYEFVDNSAMHEDVEDSESVVNNTESVEDSVIDDKSDDENHSEHDSSFDDEHNVTMKMKDLESDLVIQKRNNLDDSGMNVD